MVKRRAIGGAAHDVVDAGMGRQSPAMHADPVCIHNVSQVVFCRRTRTAWRSPGSERSRKDFSAHGAGESGAGISPNTASTNPGRCRNTSSPAIVPPTSNPAQDHLLPFEILERHAKADFDRGQHQRRRQQILAPPLRFRRGPRRRQQQVRHQRPRTVWRWGSNTTGR